MAGTGVGSLRIGTHRAVASATLASLHGLLALAYTFPWLARGTGPRNPGTISIVSYIDSLGPVWQFAFGLTAVGLLAGLMWPRWLALAHTLGGAAVAMFAAGLWIGWALSEPRPSVLTALGFTATVVWHVTISVTYARLARASVRSSRTRKAPR